MREKTNVNDVDRSMYDFRNEEKDVYRVKEGLTPAIVEKISSEKHDPVWMQNFRLESLQIYNEMKVPDWGPSIEGLNMDDIVTYVRPNTKMSAKWSDVPEDIKDTFEKLGIPQAERKSLAGVGAQYDSELVYHNVREEVAAQGVVYTDMESALTGEYADMVKKHFMKLVTPRDHKFAALHGAVWSGGSFVYVPKGVKAAGCGLAFGVVAGAAFLGAGAVRGTRVAGVGDASLLQCGICAAALSGRSFFAS